MNDTVTIRVVIFADGTWTKIERDGSGTNVVKLRNITLDDPNRVQVT